MLFCPGGSPSPRRVRKMSLSRNDPGGARSCVPPSPLRPGYGSCLVSGLDLSSWDMVAGPVLAFGPRPVLFHPGPVLSGCGPGLGPPLLPSLFPVQMKRPQVALPAAVYRNMILIRIFFCCSRRGCIRHRRGCRRIRRRCHARFWDGLRLRRSSCLRNRCRSGRR